MFASGFVEATLIIFFPCLDEAHLGRPGQIPRSLVSMSLNVSLLRWTNKLERLSVATIPPDPEAWDRIHNPSFSSLLTNGPNNGECLSV